MRQRQAWIIVAWMVAGLLNGGCQPSSSDGPLAAGRSCRLRIAAASDLTYALPALIRRYRDQHPAVDIEVVFGSTGNLFAQVHQQAPFDLFLAADADYPRRLVAQGLVPESALFPYATGRLAVWVRRDSPLDIDRLGIRVVLEPSVQKVAMANPRHAPYGRAAQAALQNLGLADEVAERLVLGENVAQAAQLVANGGAEVGLLSLSIAAAPQQRETGRYCEVPAAAYPPLQQMGVVLASGSSRAAAEAFRDFLISPAGQTLLAEYGLQPAARPSEE